MTRAQAWIILKGLLKDEIPEILQSTSDEVSTKGNLFAKVKNTTASAVDTVTTPGDEVVGGGLNVSNIGKKKGDADEGSN